MTSKTRIAELRVICDAVWQRGLETERHLGNSRAYASADGYAVTLRCDELRRLLDEIESLQAVATAR